MQKPNSACLLAPSTLFSCGPENTAFGHAGEASDVQANQLTMEITK
jgi:hypothetical protein